MPSTCHQPDEVTCCGRWRCDLGRSRIVDGYFDTVPSVWHKEILVAMQRGVHVFGASSMGALRAAELHPFGMVGIGQVYEWYRDGTIDADDEVAVAHGPAEFAFAATVGLARRHQGRLQRGGICGHHLAGDGRRHSSRWRELITTSSGVFAAR